MKHSALSALLIISALLPAASRAADTAISITDAYAPASLSGSMMAAGFMRITNHSQTDCSLRGVSGDASDAIELHETSDEHGVMKMRKVDMLPIPKGQTISLQSGGLHLMFIGLHKPFTAGETVSVTLDFGDCGSITQPLVIKPKS